MELTINHLSKTYPNGVQALKDVTFSIPTGMFGLLGPNGAGKSTLMRIIATLLDADSGEVHFGDIDVLKQKDETRRILGYLPQEFGVYPKVSALAMLDHIAMLKGVAHRSERKELVDALLQRARAIGGAEAAIFVEVTHQIVEVFGLLIRRNVLTELHAAVEQAARFRFQHFVIGIGERSR